MNVKLSCTIILSSCLWACTDSSNRQDDVVTTQFQCSDSSNRVGQFKLQTKNETDFFLKADWTSGNTDDFYFSNSTYFFFDRDGFLVDENDLKLRIIPVNDDGSPKSVSQSVSNALQLDFDTGYPKATSQIAIAANLPADSLTLDVSLIDSTPAGVCPDSGSYHTSTSTIIYDSFGVPHELTFYFVKTNQETNTWSYRAAIDCDLVSREESQLLDFGPDGDIELNSDLDSDGQVSEVSFSYSYSPDNGVAPLEIQLNLNSTVAQFTSIDSPFNVLHLMQNGCKTKLVDKLNVDEDGLVSVSFVGGDKEVLGKVLLSKFPSPGNLVQTHCNNWQQTYESGLPRTGVPFEENFTGIYPIEFKY